MSSTSAALLLWTENRQMISGWCAEDGFPIEDYDESGAIDNRGASLSPEHQFVVVWLTFPRMGSLGDQLC